MVYVIIVASIILAGGVVWFVVDSRNQINIEEAVRKQQKEDKRLMQKYNITTYAAEKERNEKLKYEYETLKLREENEKLQEEINRMKYNSSNKE